MWQLPWVGTNLGQKLLKAMRALNQKWACMESQFKTKGMPQDGVLRRGEIHEQLERRLQVDNLSFEDLDAHQTIEFPPH